MCNYDSSFVQRFTNCLSQKSQSVTEATRSRSLIPCCKLLSSETYRKTMQAAYWHQFKIQFPALNFNLDSYTLGLRVIQSKMSAAWCHRLMLLLFNSEGGCTNTFSWKILWIKNANWERKPFCCLILSETKAVLPSWPADLSSSCHRPLAAGVLSGPVRSTCSHANLMKCSRSKMTCNPTT